MYFWISFLLDSKINYKPPLTFPLYAGLATPGNFLRNGVELNNMGEKIIFSTGNKRKVNEANAAAQLFNVNVEQVELDIAEIQSDEPLKISEYKVRSAYKIVKKPVVVTDTFWNIPSLNGFPGAYMKSVTEWFSEQDFINLMAGKDDRTIAFSENISYYDGKQFKQFTKEYWGNFVEIPRGNGLSIENVVEFDGVTLGERREQGVNSHKPEDYVWSDFFKWYTINKI